MFLSGYPFDLQLPQERLGLGTEGRSDCVDRLKALEIISEIVEADGSFAHDYYVQVFLVQLLFRPLVER